MKIIKIGKPYRKHKCSQCKSIYIYHISDDKNRVSNLIYCPVCGDYLDFHFYDKKISEEQYKNYIIINNNCSELTTTESEFESLKRWNE